MNHNFSFALLVTTLLFITSCSSPQQKPTSTPQTPPPTTATLSSPITTKTNQQVLVPTPYIPKLSQPKASPIKKAVSTDKPVQKKAPQPSKTQPSKKPSKIAKKSPPIKAKPVPTKKKSSPTSPVAKKTTTKPTVRPATITPPEISVSLEALPLTIGPWTLSESQRLSNQCSLASTINKMHDGQGNTPVYLEITQQHIIFHTKSNIDTSYTGTGAFIGQQKTFPIEQLHTPTSILFDTNYEAFVNTMKNHDSLEIKVGFWPSWPVTQTYATTFKTEHFKAAYSALKKCDDML